MKEYKFRINGKDYDVVIGEIDGKNAEVTVNGASYNVELENAPAVAEPAPVKAPEAKTEPVAATAPAPAAAPTGKGEPVNSPLPGVIIEVSVKEGQAVKAGQKVAVLEAMKMENEIIAPCAGTVSNLSVQKGSTVSSGQLLCSIG